MIDLCEGWRAHHFDRFLQSDRRENADWHSIADWMQQFRKVALELGPSLCFPPLAQLGEHQALRTVAHGDVATVARGTMSVGSAVEALYSS